MENKNGAPVILLGFFVVVGLVPVITGMNTTDISNMGTGCYVRVHHGRKPACVKACPTGALRLIDLDVPEEIVPELSLRQRSMEMLSKQV